MIARKLHERLQSCAQRTGSQAVAVESSRGACLRVGRAEFGARLLRVAEGRTDSAQAGRQAAEAVTAAERAARQVMEQMLKAEAALGLADAALADAGPRRFDKTVCVRGWGPRPWEGGLNA
eukprot:1377757-Prymnesium_polylepis.1